MPWGRTDICFTTLFAISLPPRTSGSGSIARCKSPSPQDMGFYLYGAVVVLLLPIFSYIYLKIDGLGVIFGRCALVPTRQIKINLECSENEPQECSIGSLMK